MDSNSLLRDALNLSPAERLYLIEMLSKSLSEPNLDIDNLWKDEAEKRYQALLQNKVKTIPFKDIEKKWK